MSRCGIVVPAYRAEHWIVDTIASVRGQVGAEWACVVVDDGSPDSTYDRALAAAAGDERIQVVRRPNGGPSAARNTGLRALPDDTDRVLFLDGDDALTPTAVRDLSTCLDAHPAAAGVFGVAELMQADGTPGELGVHPARQEHRRRLEAGRLVAVAHDAPATFEELAVVSSIWPPATALLRQAAVRAAGGFDEELRQSEDWDLFLRLSRRADLVAVGEHVAWYRQHTDQLTGDLYGNVAGSDDVRRKAWLDAANTPVQRRSVRSAWRQLQLRRAAHALRRVAPAVRARAWAEGARAAGGAAVLSAQLLVGRPQRGHAGLVRWMRRTV